MNKNKINIPSPADPDNMSDVFLAYYELVKILRRECPWDRKQTNKSIAHLIIEEAYEMIEAIESGDDEEFSKELGDLLLHVVMHSIMANQRGAFDLINVIHRNHEKLVYRHPHVFGDTEVSGESEVVKNWEALKMQEGQKSVLQGVPKAMPALLRAQRMQHKASRVGFDWSDKDDVWAKVEEELNEFKEALNNGNKDNTTEELGDLLFSIVNAARFEDIVAEQALQKTNNKFTKRFEYIEQKAKQQNRNLDDMTLKEMDELWEEAKKK